MGSQLYWPPSPDLSTNADGLAPPSPFSSPPLSPSPPGTFESIKGKAEDVVEMISLSTVAMAAMVALSFIMCCRMQGGGPCAWFFWVMIILLGLGIAVLEAILLHRSIVNGEYADSVVSSAMIVVDVFSTATALRHQTLHGI